MGKLVAVVGVTGAGKTTLVRALCRKGNFNIGLEQHAERPFQSLFNADPRFALANQIDYLLQRTKQESQLRQSSKVSLVDGGLDLDFHGFTRLFYARGLLNRDEYFLCQDFYSFLRSIFPHPELIIRLLADHNVISNRLAARERINIARAIDLEQFERFLDEWLATMEPDIILNVDTSGDDLDYSRTIPVIMGKMPLLAI
jgi:deoxyadenosine/deoxycytidine kinase